jgi:MFS family permease
LIVGCLPVVAFAVAMPLGAGGAAVQEIMPNQMRALASAIYFFIINLIALGFGPTLVAVLTDYVFKNEKMVGSSLVVVGLLSGTLALICFYFGRKPYARSLENLKRYMQNA